MTARAALALCAAFGAAFLAQPESARAQNRGLTEKIAEFVLPDILGEVHALRAAIAAMPDTLPAGRRAQLERVDAIYDTALVICEGVPRQALLACAIATLPYRSFPAVLPLAGLVVRVPVSTESVAEFEARRARLPVLLLADAGGAGADKLPHFFGSAYLRLVLGSAELAALAGVCVEWGEALFKLEGFEDEMDLRANALGVCFAEHLRVRPAARPSDVLFSGSACR